MTTWRDVLANLFGVLIGAALGISLTILWDRRKKRAEDLETLHLTTQSLDTELATLVDQAELMDHCIELEAADEGISVEINLPYLNDAAFRTACSS